MNQFNALQPRALLFLSCDLVGSTDFKQRMEAKRRVTRDEANPSKEIPITWQQIFMEFYHQFPRTVAETRVARKSDLTFQLWKPIGDELIMTVEVETEANVFDAVAIWLDALDAYAQQMKQHNMGTKGGAFMAIFPGPDTAVAVPRDPLSEKSGKTVVQVNDAAFLGDLDHGRYVFDYFGPSIDTGFRILSQATPRYFPMSVEVAWSLFSANMHTPANIENVVFRGGYEFKGVWNGRDYPLFAADRKHSDPVNKAVKKVTNGGRPDILTSIDLCSSCLAATDWPSAIFLKRANDTRMFGMTPIDPLTHLHLDNAMDAIETSGEGAGLGSDSLPPNEAEELMKAIGEDPDGSWTTPEDVVW